MSQRRSGTGTTTVSVPGQAFAGTTSQRTPALNVRGLTKSFGDVVAVQPMDLSVERGLFYGLVGPNGAGKTTLMSMATGLLRPDAGSSEVLGTDVWQHPSKAKSLLGVLPDGLALPERLTGSELLTYVGQLRGIAAADLHARVDDLLTMMDLRSAGRTLVVDYSTGMRKKIGLALALLHAPRLLVLDEPFEAVDPVSVATLKAVLRRFVHAGGTVVLSSHVMALVEQLCDRVAVLSGGALIAEGRIQEVRQNRSLEEAFVGLVTGEPAQEAELTWLLR
jgi:ABC-2 type transport system ATP-binding protein